MTEASRFVAYRRKALLLGLAVCLAFLAGEIALRFFDVFDPPAFDDSVQYGYLMRPNQSVSTRGIRFRINNLGFRGADPAPRKADGSIRIAFVGDSITFGGGTIPEEQLFVNRVAAELTTLRQIRHEALNLSAPGWGVQNMAAYISARGVHQSDWIVWVISTVDFRRHKTNRTENGLWASKPWSRLVYGVTAVMHKSSLGRPAGADGAARASGTAILEQNIEALRASLRQTSQLGLRHAMVIVPIESETSETASDARRFESTAKSFGVPFLHLGERFQAAGPRELFEDGVHLTAKGHEVAANAITTLMRGASSGAERTPDPDVAAELRAWADSRAAAHPRLPSVSSRP